MPLERSILLRTCTNSALLFFCPILFYFRLYYYTHCPTQLYLNTDARPFCSFGSILYLGPMFSGSCFGRHLPGPAGNEQYLIEGVRLKKKRQTEQMGSEGLRPRSAVPNFIFPIFKYNSEGGNIHLRQSCRWPFLLTS